MGKHLKAYLFRATEGVLGVACGLYVLTLPSGWIHLVAYALIVNGVYKAITPAPEAPNA